MTCAHVRICKREQSRPGTWVRCLSCGQSWTEHSITLSDEDFDDCLAIMAERLDPQPKAKRR